MFSRIDASEVAWLEDWLLGGRGGYVPSGYRRHVILLHPRSQVDCDAEFVPVVGDSCEEGEPSRTQIAVLLSLLTTVSGAATTACAGLYDGTPDVPWPPELAGAATFIEDNIRYALLSGGLAELMNHNWERDQPFYDWLSFLWPTDRAWFLTCDPDSPFTVIACGDNLAQELLATPEARAVEIPGYRWDHSA